MNDLVEALVSEPLRDLTGLGALDPTQLVGVEVHEPARELAAARVADEGDDLARGEIALDLRHARRQEALAVADQRVLRAGIDGEPSLRRHRERDPALPRAEAIGLGSEVRSRRLALENAAEHALLATAGDHHRHAGRGGLLRGLRSDEH